MTDREKLIELLREARNARAHAVISALFGDIDTTIDLPHPPGDEFIADHLLASGQVIVTPCKVGDTVWFDTYKHGKMLGIQPHKIAKVRTVASIESGFAEAGADLYDFQFGKSVFLTREEAEAALKEGQG